MNPKIKHVLLITLLFFIVSNPMTYRFTDNVLSPLTGHITYGSGCPTHAGLFIHALVFAGLAYLLH